MKIETKGTLYIIAAPSGGGKTSLVRKLISQDEMLKLSISHTTRAKRPGEEEAKDYYFVNESEFEELIIKDEFIEYATVFSASYGTSKKSVLDYLNLGQDVILEIDWQGARQLDKLFVNVASIFILPPSYEELANRLRKRGQDDENVIISRMTKAKDEISHCDEFDYILFNNDFDECFSQLQAIITGNRLKYEQQKNRNAKLLSKLL